MFQQRPSAGWGDPDQLLDPVYAARAFFGGPAGPNAGEPPGLLDIDGWADMALTEAAQAVQRSALPDEYARPTPPAGSATCPRGQTAHARPAGILCVNRPSWWPSKV